MYKDKLDRILKASQNNALTFFVGAGVSALSGAPTWKELIHAISDKLGRKRKNDYSSDEYLQIPQMFYYSLEEDKKEYYKFVEKQLCSFNLEPNKIHYEMLDLNPASFITTNYDTLLEDSASQHCQSFKVVSCDEDVPKIFGDRFILKLHGDFKNKNFVLKEEDYLNYSENFKLIETLVKSIFSTNTVVFIGYGLNDYNVKLILNWTKTLLQNSFQKPIFLYTGAEKLTKEEIIYQESKGLAVLELNQFATPTDEYLDRYKSIFVALKNRSKLSLEGKSEDEAFEILYNRLCPLDCLDALRIGDVSRQLFPYARMDDAGEVYFYQDDNLLLKKFLIINQMPESQQNSLTEDILKKYHCILNVFKKARVTRVQDGNRTFIAGDMPFADKNCILLDYKSMHDFSAKNYKFLKDNYKKAFYLSQLKRYKESFFLFFEVAKQAFKEEDYLLYYLAKSNCITLHNIIKNNIYLRGDALDVIEALSPNDLEVEKLFRNLPVEFRNKYDNLNLKDIYNINMLYKYSYEAFIAGQDLREVLESRTIEIIGYTSSNKVIWKINDYLHFLLGNGIVAEVGQEYKNTVKNLMSLLVYKYSIQSKKVLGYPSLLLSVVGKNEVHFDEIDFYCFINCFDDQEIIKLLKRHHIETIEFQNMNRIETAVKNLLDYYEFSIKTSNKISDRTLVIGLISLEMQIKNCLALLRYVNISQDLVDKICALIFTHEFDSIQIKYKVLFLDYQLGHRKMFSEVTTKTIENTLISYLDQHISALINNKTFKRFSDSKDIVNNYYHLVHYIFPQEKKYCSRKLSMRISQIINNNLSQMYSQIALYYCRYVSKYQQKKLVT